MAEPVYATAEQLRVEVGLAADDTGSLSDADAARLIENAEDRIDSILPQRAWARPGARILPQPPATDPLETLGRKVDPAQLDGWQADKLARATCKAAALERADPKAYAGQQWKSVSGPDFSYSGPTTKGGQAALPEEVASLLVVARLIPATAKA